MTGSQMRQTGTTATKDYVKAFHEMLEALVASKPHEAYGRGHRVEA